jgi:hypothetical protein
MREIYSEAAAYFRDSGNRRPSHCDVRCTVNDIQNHYAQDGHKVYFGYSRDRAFSVVRKLLSTI